MIELTIQQAIEITTDEERSKMRSGAKEGVGLLMLQNGGALIFVKKGTINKNQGTYLTVTKEEIILISEVPARSVCDKIKAFVNDAAASIFDNIDAKVQV